MRVNFYIDGFNFYYGLKSKGWRKYYWLDLVLFCESFLKPGQIIGDVLYFTATPSNQGKKDRQDLFFSANKLNPKFKLVFGKFVRKKVRYGGQEYLTFEEKQTDVNIAVEMIKNVVQNKCDISVLISADSDLIPPINLIRELDPKHRLFTYFPPNRYSIDLLNNSDITLKLNRYEHRFKKAVLEEKITLKNGYVITRPSGWR